MINETVQASAQIYSEKARESMMHHGIPDAPQNFWIWHTYHSGANPDLGRAIDILLSNRREFTDQTNEEIFELLGTAREHQVIRETTQRVAATLDALMRFIDEAGAGVSSYNKKLSGLSKQVVAGKPLPGLSNILMSETRTIEHQSELLQQRLAIDDDQSVA